ncbi:MAG TPA: PH domain-containing protein, partial [Saprospiraceae bacterium]|nr:PH domain-containing protein [Saprospiraceae bacterium]
MERKSEIAANYNFSKPQKQHITGLVIILLKQYRVAISNFLPLLILIFLKKESSDFIYYGIAAFLIIFTIVSILKYFTIKYHLNDRELIYQSGILSKKKITIPFENIMNIDYEQNIVQQVLEVAKLKVETAGSSKEEIELYALKLDTIKDIRSIIFENKAIHVSSKNEDRKEVIEDGVNQAAKRQLIFQRSSINLLKSGLAANHLQTGGLIIALLFSFGQRLREWSIIPEYDEYEESLYNFMSTVKVFLIVMAIFLVLSVLVSMVRQVILYFELRFYRTADGFYVSRGLFNKQLIAVKDQKIQSITYKQNILRKLIGMYDFSMQKIGDLRHQINIPGMDIDYINQTIAILYPNFLDREWRYSKISPFYLKRALVFIISITLVLVTTLFILEIYELILIPILLGIFLSLSFYLKYQKMGYSIDDAYVVIKGGRFGTKQKIIPVDKLQMITLSDSPYQRNNQLKSIHLADGG